MGGVDLCPSQLCSPPQTQCTKKYSNNVILPRITCQCGHSKSSKNAIFYLMGLSFFYSDSYSDSSPRHGKSGAR